MSQAHTTGKVLAGTVGAGGLLFATAQAANAATVTVKQNDTVWSLAQEHGVSVKSIETLNKVKALDANTDLIFVGQKLQVSQNSKSNQSEKGTYTVKAGDTLWDLADEYGTSVHTLQTLNHMSGDVIVTGEQLVLPSDAKPAKSTTAKAATSTTSNKVVAEDAATNTVTAASSTSSAKPTRATSATTPSQATSTSASSTSQASSNASVSSQARTTSSSTTSVSQASASQSSSTAPTTAKRSRIVVGVQKAAPTSSSSSTTATSASSSTATSTAAQSSTSTTSAAAQSTPASASSTTSQAAQSSTTSAAAKSNSISQASSTSATTSTAAATPTSASTTQTAVKRTARKATVKRAATTASSTTAQSSAATVQSSASQSSATTPKQTTAKQTTTQRNTATTAAKTQSSSAKSTANTANLSSGSVTGLAMKLASANIPYVYGGSSLSGMDCSGLVAYVYQHAAGISLPHSTTAQEAYVSVHSVKDAQPGDILFWGSRGGTYHDAIYLGNNQYVAAPTEGQNVEVQTISSYFAPSFAGTVK